MIETPHLWIPKVKIIEPKDELPAMSNVQGWYKLVARKRDGSSRILADWFPNLVLDSGLNRIGTNADWLLRCVVGTGNTAPAVGNTTLVAQVASTTTVMTNNGGAQASAPYYGYRQITYRFAEGTAAGNLAEVGVGPSSGDLFSRALILDGGGSPTTVTVLSDESLDVSYELRCYPPLSDVISTISISGTTYDYTLRASDVITTGWAPGANGSQGGSQGVNSVFSYSGPSVVIGDITGVPTGHTGGVPVNGTNTGSYSSGSYTRDFTATWSLIQGNTTGGIGAVAFQMGTAFGAGGLGKMQIKFTPNIPKAETNILTLNFRHTWARRP